MNSIRYGIIFLLAGLPVSVQAIPISWELDGAFGGSDSGAALRGSLTYDADTNTYSSIFLVSTAGQPLLTGAGYTVAGPLAGANRLDVLSSAAADLTGAFHTIINWNGPLTNAGGTLSATSGFEQLCSDPPCTPPGGFGPTVRGIAGGTMLTAPRLPRLLCHQRARNARWSARWPPAPAIFGRALTPTRP